MSLVLINKTRIRRLNYNVAFLFAVLLLFSGCGHSLTETPPDASLIPQLDAALSSNKSLDLETDNLALYVDYSKCISDGQHSSFFQILIPSLVTATKHYFSIKGPVISEEKGINVYMALKNIEEVSYADLKHAAQMITNGNQEAVLLTDGEYYQNNIAGGNVNTPYLAEPFTQWLRRGHDVYILSEPYQEKNHGKLYNKKRFYFIFTDHRIKGNIYDRIVGTVNLSSYPEIGFYHLSATDPHILGLNKTAKLNPNLGASSQSLDSGEIEDWNVDWPTITKYLIDNSVDDNGQPLPNGATLIEGLKVDKDSYGAFKIKDVDLKVDNINAPYADFWNERNAKVQSTVSAQSLVEISDSGFEINKKEFANTGEVKISINPMVWNPDLILTGAPFNYTRLDICVKSIQNVFDQDADLFVFDAIGGTGDEKNVSVRESIKQCLFDDKIQEMMMKPIIYTIYIKSNKR